MRKVSSQWWDHLLVCLVVFVLGYVLWLASLNLSIFNPLKQALEDFKMTDVYFEMLQGGEKDRAFSDVHPRKASPRISVSWPLKRTLSRSGGSVMFHASMMGPSAVRSSSRIDLSDAAGIFSGSGTFLSVMCISPCLPFHCKACAASASALSLKMGLQLI